MSAICGAISLGESPLPDSILARMMQALYHHGPDDRGYWHNAGVVLGHQMMHITPESLSEKLPFHHSESQLTITADARLDNREDLFSAMGIASAPNITDSQLILMAYQKWGPWCADRLIGEFSFAIWDEREQCLHCVTDPMGIRPFFYKRVTDKYLAFASEVTALLNIEKSSTALNYRRFALLGISAMTKHLEAESTCFEGIYRLPAATVLSVSRHQSKSVQYWAPDASKRIHFKTIGEFQEAYREVTFKSIKSRARSAFPVASFLSGGLDSSSIVATASQILSKENKSLITLSSVPTPDAAEQVTGEREFINEFASWQNLDMTFVDANGCGPFDEVEKLVQTASPCSYSFQHFLYSALIRSANSKGARIILDGHGGELSVSASPSGYFAELLLQGKLRKLIKELRIFDPESRLRLAPIKRLVLRPLVPYPLQLFFNRQSRFKRLLPYPIKKEFVADILGNEIDAIQTEIDRLLHEYPDHRKNLVSNIRFEQINVQQRSHAGFVDYHKARISYPYLDRRVIEFSLATDGMLKYNKGVGRQLLRLGMAGVLPISIQNRTSKAAFSPDYHLRYSRDKHMARDYVLDRSRHGKISEIIDFKEASSALEKEHSYHPENPILADHASQILVPNAVYLCYFLSRYLT